MKENNINENKNIKDTEFIEVNNNEETSQENKENSKEKKTKKKISKGKIIGFSIIGVLLCGTIAAGAITHEIMDRKDNNPIEQAKENIEMKFAETPNYTLDQAKEIALKKVPGTIVNTKEEVDDGIVEYEIQIKDKENMLQEVNVDGKTGAITEIDNNSHDNDHHDHNSHRDN